MVYSKSAIPFLAQNKMKLISNLGTVQQKFKNKCVHNKLFAWN